MASRDEQESARYTAVRLLLSQSAAYPDRPTSVQIIETHISCVFLTDTLVYKLKKPVHFEFVDFSTLAARHAACLAEVRLNRRLAPDVYLGVLPITEADKGTLALNGAGRPVEWVVEMRRLPSERTLEVLLRAGTSTVGDMESLALLLGNFYAQAQPVPIEEAAYRQEIERHVRANRADLTAVAPPEDLPDVRRAHAAQLQFLLLQPEAFDARVRARRVIDGHGDLRPEHICLTEPPVIFDCLEFDSQLRRVDVADELSFLTMECRRLGAADLGASLREACLARCGDDPPAELLAFYESYRACVRAKVAVLRARQLSDAQRSVAWSEAAEYLRLAVAAAREFAGPLLLVVGGLMGSGKTTLAAALADQLGCEALHTDAIRRELFGASPEAAEFDAGVYTPENRQRVYRELFDRSVALLRGSASVVIDGTFLAADTLRSAIAAADAAHATRLVIRCRCPDTTARGRIAARQAVGKSLSEARPELFDRQRAEAQDIPPDVPHILIDTTREITEQVAAVIERLRR